MASKGSALPHVSGTSDSARRRGRKTSITRVRTGCLTCRKRKKKCDERKPTCLHCEKGNYVCEGFLPQELWHPRVTRGRTSTPKLTQGEYDATTLESTDAAEGQVEGDSALQWLPSVPYSSMVPTNDSSNFHNDSMFDVLFNQNTASWETEAVMTNTPTLYPEITVSEDNCSGFTDTRSSRKQFDNFYPGKIKNAPDSVGQYRIPSPKTNGCIPSCTTLTPQKQDIPRGLPFLINGVDTPIHQRLFRHFRDIAHILTTFADKNENPLYAVVIPLAVQDVTVMRAILA